MGGLGVVAGEAVLGNVLFDRTNCAVEYVIHRHVIYTRDTSNGVRLGKKKVAENLVE